MGEGLGLESGELGPGESGGWVVGRKVRVRWHIYSSGKEKVGRGGWITGMGMGLAGNENGGD